MAVIIPDFSEVTERTPVAPGTYSARITDCEAKTSKTGNDYLNWKMTLFGTPEIANRVIFHMTPVKGKGAFRLQELYKAAKGEDISKGAQFDTDQLIGSELSVTLVEGRDQDGNVRSFPDVKAVTALKN